MIKTFNAESYDADEDDWEVVAYRPSEQEARDTRNEMMRGKVGRGMMSFDYKIEETPDKNGWYVLSRPRIRRAESYGVEFNDWAKQEMLTHGEDISFKEWAQDESEKHGDMDLEDWAEHEEESHDERYGAEDIKHYEKLPSDMPDATIYDFAVDKGDEKSRLDFAKEILEEEFSSKTHKIISYNDDFDQMFYRIVKKDEYGAERYWDKDTDSYREIYKHSIEVREFPKSSSVYQNGKLVKQYKGQGHFNNATAYAQKLENDYVPKSFFSENMTSKLKSPYVIGAFAIGLGIPYITSFLNSKKDK